MKKLGSFITLAALGFAAMLRPTASSTTHQPDQLANGRDARRPQAESQASPEAQETLRKLLAQKKTYRVGYNPALERKTIELYGVEIPKDESRRANAIHAKAERSLAELGRRQEEYMNSHPGTDFRQNSAYERVMRDYRARHPRGPVPEKLEQVAPRLEKFDWGDHVQFTVRDQGQTCANCWAFASIGAFEAVVQLQSQLAQSIIIKEVDGKKIETPPSASPHMSFSVQSLINCITKDKADCEGGWHGSAFAFIVDSGAAPVSGKLPKGVERVSDRYIGNKLPCEEKAGVRGVTWDYVNLSHPDQAPSVREMKIALLAHGPLAALVVVDDAFKAYLGGVFNEHTAGNGTHAILITGWDNEKKAWRILNSWGEKWGEQGFMWIAWDSNNIGQWAAWIEAPIIF